MKKSKKIILIVLLSLTIALGITYIVFYCLFKDQTSKITMDVIDYICNKPLPVAGVSALVLALTIIKIAKLILANKSISIKTILAELAKSQSEINYLKQLIEDKDKEIKQLVEQCSNENKNTNDLLKEVCMNVPNKKVKKIGEKIHGNSVTKTKEI